MSSYSGPTNMSLQMMDLPTKARPRLKRDGKRIIYEAGIVCSSVALLCLFIAYSSPYWIISWPRVYSGFKRIGMWEACFAGLVLEMDPDQKAYHGCWWILAPEFFGIRAWVMPVWFIVTQVATTLCVVAEIVGLFLLVLLWYKTGGTQEGGRYKKREPIGLLQTAIAITVFTGVCMCCTCILFAVGFYLDFQWLPNPYLNYLSWSYGLAVLSSFFSTFASIALVTYVMIVRQEMREPPPAVPKQYDSTTGSGTLLKSSRGDVSFGKSSRGDVSFGKAARGDSIASYGFGKHGRGETVGSYGKTRRGDSLGRI